MADLKEITIKGEELFGVIVTAKKQTFKKNVERMKELGKTHYDILSYNGQGFTTSDPLLTKAVEEKKLDTLKVRETLNDEGVKGLEVLYFITNEQREALDAKEEAKDEREHNREVRKAKRILFSPENFRANPALFTQVENLEKVLDASA